MTSPLDAFEAIAFSDVLVGRLSAAKAELSRKQGLAKEKAWLDTALERLTAAREGLGDLLLRALCLDELAPAREAHARTLQQAAVDAVERLQAGITFHGGRRSPVLEALYGKLKVSALRRAEREEFEKFCTNFEKRLNGTYVKRLLADESFAPIVAAVAEVRASFSSWRRALAPEPIAEPDAQRLCQELEAAARRLELPMHQARLLAEAACAPVKDLAERFGFAAKPKRRAVKPASPPVAAKAVAAEAEEVAAALEHQQKTPPTRKERGRNVEAVITQ
jgi:hypothetical protein